MKKQFAFIIILVTTTILNSSFNYKNSKIQNKNSLNVNQNIDSNFFQLSEKEDTIIQSITFKVSDVKLSTSELLETTYKRALERRINRVITDYPEEYKDEWICPVDFNAFIAAIHFAYCDHRPLIISPDMIWLTICQGFSIHLNENYEELRDKVVEFDGIKKITVRRDDFFVDQHNNWNEVFDMFADSVKYYTKDSLYNLMVPEFSTTGSLEHTAFVVTLLEATKKYFAATTESGCGIPEITLEGSVEDWEWIRKNIENFRKYDLEIWVDNLIPVLDEIIETSKGNIDSEFWESIYKYSIYYNKEYCSGWIIKFFPYYQEWAINYDGEKAYKYLKYYKNTFIENTDYIYSTLSTANFPNGYSKYEFIWDYQYTGEKFNMEVYSGFMGIKQNKETKALKPIISWVLYNTNLPWLDDNGSFVYTKMKEPLNIWLPNNSSIDFEQILGNVPLINKPIFRPDSCSNYYDGIANLNKYINSQICKIDSLNILKGIVKVKFIISWEGRTTDFEIIKGTDGKEDEIAKEIILSLPKWKPAWISTNDFDEYDYNVNYSQTLNIDFDVNEK